MRKIFSFKWAEALNRAGVIDAGGCMVWAFGEDFMSLKLRDTPEVWNKKHSELFKVSDSDNILETTEKIGRAYLARS